MHHPRLPPNTDSGTNRNNVSLILRNVYISIKPRPAHQLSHPLSRDYHASTFPMYDAIKHLCSTRFTV